MAIIRTPIIDDDGSNTTGTPIDNFWKQEFYDQIDGAISTPWQDAIPQLITDDVGTNLVNTISHARYQRIGAAAVLWSMNIGNIQLPAQTQSIWLSYLPFFVANLTQMNAVDVASYPSYLVPYSGDRIQIRRLDLAPWTAGSYYFVFQSYWEVV
jgi:hypothetical protein